MDDGHDKLNLLLHAFAEFLNFLVPPARYAEFHKPVAKLLVGFFLVHAFQLSEINGLLADFHLLVKPAFFWEIADVCDIAWL